MLCRIDQASQFKTELDKQANITQAESEINCLRLKLEALKDKTITITAKTIEAKNNGGVVGFATGGQVPGIGNTDTVPAILTPGEVVITFVTMWLSICKTVRTIVKYKNRFGFLCNVQFF